MYSFDTPLVKVIMVKTLLWVIVTNLIAVPHRRSKVTVPPKGPVTVKYGENTVACLSPSESVHQEPTVILDTLRVRLQWNYHVAFAVQVQ